MNTIEFNSKDGVLITADYYDVEGHKGMILLCHRSHANRAEYRKTAVQLNLLGFSCLAIDQRSGMKVWGETNETKKRAKEQGLTTGYLDARIDIEAGIEQAYLLNARNPIILLGSSYSASLALFIGEEDSHVKAVVAFSPNECLKGFSMRSELKTFKKPTFVTAPPSERSEVEAILQLVDSPALTHFRSDATGFHGSKTLWEDVEGSEEYWKGVRTFLNELK